MRHRRRAQAGPLTVAVAFCLALLALPGGGRSVAAQGVGGATWTPLTSTTSVLPSTLLVTGDALVFETQATWDRAQADGLADYVGLGLRYTHETNDRAGRLSATGYWATNHPDPAYDRDDDDGDGRWEEAEIIAGSQGPEPGQAYVSLVQFSRWHGKRQKGSCEWAWDRRLGQAEVLSQLSRNLLGEWQAERYTMTYETVPYPRVGERPAIPDGGPRARCGDPRPADSQVGVVVTFAEPLAWAAFAALPEAGTGRWTAFEAVGSSTRDALTWTCGGPVSSELALRVCDDLGVSASGVVAAVGYFDGDALEELRASPRVARVADLRDAVTGLLFDVGGFGVERPGLTVNDDWWQVAPTGR